MMREPLCREAIHLAELMNRLFPDHAEIEGVLALMLLQDSHREARLSSSGELVLLRDQDRSCWDRDQISAGKQLLEHALHLHQPLVHSRYKLPLRHYIPMRSQQMKQTGTKLYCCMKHC
ncbi:MAG: DUF6596 domain-containing protein [bacterium]|nr:hypothetical protein [Gammaproteobacteria bacterium]HIL97672.1 hypothetical protein [Pseudomonadales bacterium]